MDTPRHTSLLRKQRIAAALAMLAVAFMLPLCCIGAGRNDVVITVSTQSDGAVTSTTETHIAHQHPTDPDTSCDPEKRGPDTMHAFLERVSAETMHRLRLDDDEPLIGETLIPLARVTYAPLPVLHAIATSIDSPPPRLAA